MARLSTIILSLFIFLASFQAQAKNPPPGTGTSDIPANIFNNVVLPIPLGPVILIKRFKSKSIDRLDKKFIILTH